MKRNQHLPESLLAHAAVRGGVFTTTHADRHGVRSLGQAVRDGECHRVRQGLYSLTRELDARSRIWAGLMIAGPSSVVGGAAADHLLGRGPEPEFVDIWTGHRQLSDRACWRFHRGSPPAGPGVERSALDSVFARMVVMSPLDRELAVRVAADCLHLADRERFLALCDESPDSTRSAFEARFSREVIWPHGLPELDWSPVPDGPDHQLRAGLSGSEPHIVFDGLAPRENARRLLTDFDPIVLAPGERLVISWSDLRDDPCRTAGRVVRRLRTQGWQGDLLDCGNCRVGTSMFSMAGATSRSAADCPTCGAQLVALWRDPHRWVA